MTTTDRDARAEAHRRIAEAIQPLRWIQTGHERYQETRVGTAEEMADAVLALFPEAHWETGFRHFDGPPTRQQLILRGPNEPPEPTERAVDHPSPSDAA